MPADVVKESIDLGIVIKDKEASLRFYRDTLGLKFVEEMPMGRGSVQTTSPLRYKPHQAAQSRGDAEG